MQAIQIEEMFDLRLVRVAYNTNPCEDDAYVLPRIWLWGLLGPVAASIPLCRCVSVCIFPRQEFLDVSKSAGQAIGSDNCNA